MADLREQLGDSLFVVFRSLMTHLVQSHRDVRMTLIWSVKAGQRYAQWCFSVQWDSRVKTDLICQAHLIRRQSLYFIATKEAP